MNTNPLIGFIVARERHRIAKEHSRGWGAVKSSPDPIISEFRFCNVRRNDDRVTKWIHGNLLEPLADDPNLWFYLVIARLFNKPDTLRAFTYAQFTQWKPEYWRKRLKEMRRTGPIFNGAYIVSTNGIASDKVDYIIDRVLKPMWQARDVIGNSIDAARTLDEAHKILMSAQGLGSFMAAQVVADLKYASPKPRWKDFDTFAASGPGSRRGLNRVMDVPIGTARTEEDFRAKLAQIRDSVNAALKQRADMKRLVPLTAQDVQNCLCEFDKYERARLGQGKPKQKYIPLEDK